MDAKRILIFVSCLLLGIVLAVFAFFGYKEIADRKNSCTIKVSAVVVDRDATLGDKRLHNTRYTPIFKYTYQDNAYKVRYYTPINRLNIGDNVTLYLNKNDPSYVYYPNIHAMWCYSLFFSVCSFIASIVSLFFKKKKSYIYKIKARGASTFSLDDEYFQKGAV